MATGPSSRLFVGGLPPDTHVRELEDVFGPFGRIRDIHLPHVRPNARGAFAFVEYDHAGDAEEACRQRDGYRFGRDYLRVEVAKGRPSTRGDWPGAPGAPPRGGRGEGGQRAGPKRSEHKVLVEGLPDGASWQDLKDFVRDGVRDIDPRDFFNVVRAPDSGAPLGVVEFAHREAMLDAIRSLDGAEFRDRRNRENVSIVRFIEDGPRGGADAAPPARGRSRSRSRSPRRGRSPGRSRSPPPRSRSPPAEREPAQEA